MSECVKARIADNASFGNVLEPKTRTATIASFVGYFEDLFPVEGARRCGARGYKCIGGSKPTSLPIL